MDDKGTIVNVAATILLAVGGLASLVGRSSAARLRLIVSDALRQHLTTGEQRAPSSIFSADFVITECTSGRAANFLSVIAEVIGVLLNSEIWSLSINRESPSKYDGSLFLFVPSLLSGCLYFLSHFIRLNPVEKVSQFVHSYTLGTSLH